MMSTYDYEKDKTTTDYRNAVDKAYDIADKVAKKNLRKQKGLTVWQNDMQKNGGIL